MNQLVIDSDSHVMEPPNLWRQHIARRHRNLALSIVEKSHLRDELPARRAFLMFNRKPLFPVCGSTPTGVRALEASAHLSRNKKAYNAHRERLLAVRDSILGYEEQTPPPGFNAHARVRWMDSKGIARAIILPTWGSMWERYLHDRPDAVAANMAAYNRWIVNFCSTQKKRLIPIGQVSPNNLKWSLSELPVLAKSGVRAILLRPVLYQGVPLSHESFDTFWATIADLDLAVYFHVSGMGRGAADFFEAGWYLGETRGQHNGVIWSVGVHVPMMLTLTSMIRDQFFDRFPRLRLVSAEQGFSWVRPWLHELDSHWKLMAARGFVRSAGDHELPSDLIKEHVWFAGVHGADLNDAVATSMLERVMFSSDFPHPECAGEPVEEFLLSLKGLASAKRGNVMAANCEAFLGERRAS